MGPVEVFFLRLQVSSLDDTRFNTLIVNTGLCVRKQRGSDEPGKRKGQFYTEIPATFRWYMPVKLVNARKGL
jgi:hypothetical protein